jgi:hypothetical protein
MDTENTQQFRTLPNDSESFGNVPQASEPFGTLPHVSERKENHIYTVRQAARMFEDAGVARTERSITNWCRPDASGVSRLDAYYDINEHKYFITLASIERAIAEEQAKGNIDSLPNPSESTPRVASSVPHASEEQRHTSDRGGETDDRDPRIKELEKEIFDLKILNAGKDFFIKRLEDDRVKLSDEQRALIDRLIDHSHRIGQLETRLAIEAPKQQPPSPASRTVEAEFVSDQQSFPSPEHHRTSEASPH